MISQSQKDFIRQGIQMGIRPDGRELTEIRDLSIETGVLEQSSGSSLIIWGNTRVIVGVGLAIGETELENDDEGSEKAEGKIRCSIECSSITSVNSDYGLFLESSLNSSLDLKSLHIIPGVSWVLNVKVMVIDNGGNLLDAICLGIRTALYTTQIPKVDIQQVDGNFDYDLLDEVEYLQMREAIPISTTIYQVGSTRIVDPTIEEELCSDARVSVLLDNNGNIVGMLKDQAVVDSSVLVELIKVAKKKGMETFTRIKKK